MSAAPLRVLVVDDETSIRKLLRLGLNAHDYETLEAANGKTALEPSCDPACLWVSEISRPSFKSRKPS